MRARLGVLFPAAVSLCTAAVLCAASAAHGQQRSLGDLLAPGQQVTCSQASNGHSLQVYSEQERKTLLVRTALLSRAGDVERGVVARWSAAAAARREVEGVAPTPLEQSIYRMVRTRSRTPVAAPEFFEVVEVGQDFIGLRRERVIQYLALSSIQKVVVTDSSDEESAPYAQFQLALAQAEALARMLVAFRLDLGQFPTAEHGLEALLRPPMDVPDPDRWRGPYFALSAIPNDPWDHAYRWRIVGDGEVVEVRSNGPDGAPDNEDDVVHRIEPQPTPAAARVLVEPF